MLDVPEPFNSERLLALMQTHAQRNAITLPDGVTEALDLAYHVSMHVEEGRPLLVAFALTRGGKLNSELLLTPPVRKFEELRRLAPAAGREWLCVRFGQDHDGEWSALSIAPRQELPKTIWKDRFWGHIVFVESAGPGCVVLKINDHQVRYERGRYVTYDPLGSVRAILPPFVREAMAEPILAPFADRHDRLPPYVLVDEHAYTQHFEAFEKVVRDAAEDAATDGAYFLAEYTNRLHHGGTVLIVENPKAILRDSSLATARHILSSVKEPDERWNAAMLELLEWESHRRLAATGVTVLAGLSGEVSRRRGAQGVDQGAVSRAHGWMHEAMVRSGSSLRGANADGRRDGIRSPSPPGCDRREDSERHRRDGREAARQVPRRRAQPWPASPIGGMRRRRASGLARPRGVAGWTCDGVRALKRGRAHAPRDHVAGLSCAMRIAYEIQRTKTRRPLNP